MFVDSAAVCLVVGPVAIVDVSIDMNETTFTMSSVLAPLSAIFGSIIPGLLTETVTEATLPLACVDCSSLESVGRTLFPLLVWIVSILRYRLTSFFLGEILATAKLLGTKKRYETASCVATPERLQRYDLFHL